MTGNSSAGDEKNKTVVGGEEVDLCVECFGKGVEFGQHKREHSYRVINPLDFSVYEPDWRADEELLLLEAVEANGMGNWIDIADQVGSKTAKECEQHYRKLYLDWPGRPLPVTYSYTIVLFTYFVIESCIYCWGQEGKGSCQIIR